MTSLASPLPLIDDELDLLGELLPLAGQEIIELGCGNARLARALLDRHPGSRVTGLEVDQRQHAKNLAAPQPGLRFVAAAAQAVPFPDASFDLALMLKSLHHVPQAVMAQALREAARVLHPGGHLYVSEPVYDGAFNDVVRLFNEERVVRAAAQAALDEALRGGAWVEVADRRFETSVQFRDFDDFEERMMRATYHDHRIDEATHAAVRTAFERHLGPEGARFTRPMHVRLLRTTGQATAASPESDRSLMNTAANSPSFSDPAGTWNRRFKADGYLFGTEPNAWLREHADVWRPGQRVLCVADGEGRNSVWLARRGLAIDAFDVAEVGVAKARRLAAAHGVSVDYAVADCDSLAWPQGVYDGVAAIFVQFADPAVRERLFANIRRCLKPGGTLVLQGYTPKQLEYKTGGPPIASHLYTQAMLREAFAGMEILELREYEAEVDEGSGHRGRSALIGMVARRR